MRLEIGRKWTSPGQVGGQGGSLGCVHRGSGSRAGGGQERHQGVYQVKWWGLRGTWKTRESCQSWESLSWLTWQAVGAIDWAQGKNGVCRLVHCDGEREASVRFDYFLSSFTLLQRNKKYEKTFEWISLFPVNKRFLYVYFKRLMPHWWATFEGKEISR